MLGDFYTILELDQNNGEQVKAKIELNPNHAIFKVHFPGNPIAPGVCLVQIIKEISTKVLNKELFMHKADNIKFMAKINPNIHPIQHFDLDIKLRDDMTYSVSTTTHSEGIVFFKFKGNFKVF